VPNDHARVRDANRKRRVLGPGRNAPVVSAVRTVEQVIDAEKNAPMTWAKVETISGDVVAERERIFQGVTKGGIS
jgi:hypothetical protein